MSVAPRLRTILHPALLPSPEPLLLVLLPGFDMRAEDFGRHGFLDATRRRAACADVLVAEPDLDLYLEGEIGAQIAALLRSIERPYPRIWLAGISLGCFGALMTLEHAAAIDGVILLAPFLGTAGLIAEIGRAGGLAAWQPGDITAGDHERRLLARLKTCRSQPDAWPALYLGYGRSDRFAAASRLLADLLPPARVIEIEGTHDWPSWARLWKLILAAEPFGRDAARPMRSKLDI